MNRVERFNRMLMILSEVVRHPGRVPAELASACGVSERTLRRDLHELRRLGFDLTYEEGYQLQGRLNLEGGVTLRTLAVPLVWEQQLRLLRESFPTAVADAVQARVEAEAPGALAQLFARALAQEGKEVAHA